MSQVAGSNSSYKHITNRAWVQARLCKLQKGCIRLAAASDKVYQLLAHGRWFSPGTLASCTTKAGRHDIAAILLKVALNTKNQSIFFVGVHVFLFSGDDDAGLLLGTWMYIVCQYFRSSQGFPFYIVGEIVSLILFYCK